MRRKTGSRRGRGGEDDDEEEKEQKEEEKKNIEDKEEGKIVNSISFAIPTNTSTL